MGLRERRNADDRRHLLTRDSRFVCARASGVTLFR
jgi:hypothetical protein